MKIKVFHRNINSGFVSLGQNVEGNNTERIDSFSASRDLRFHDGNLSQNIKGVSFPVDRGFSVFPIDLLKGDLGTSLGDLVSPFRNLLVSKVFGNTGFCLQDCSSRREEWVPPGRVLTPSSSSLNSLDFS